MREQHLLIRGTGMEHIGASAFRFSRSFQPMARRLGTELLVLQTHDAQQPATLCVGTLAHRCVRRGCGEPQTT
jgi:hypothetical protein